MALPYLPQMIESFGIPQNEVAGWVGIATSVISGGQCLLGMPWGLISDYMGRKPVLLACLTFGMLFTLMTGFSKSLITLIMARGGLGLVSGNVGIARAMASELVPHKEKRTEAFNILYMSLSLAGILGPALGGILVEPEIKFPNSIGKVALLKQFPYLLPSLVVSILFIAGITVGFLFLEETLEAKRSRRDYGLIISRRLRQLTTRHGEKASQYQLVENPIDSFEPRSSDEIELPSYADQPQEEQPFDRQAKTRPAYPPISGNSITNLYRKLSKRTIYILLAHTLIALHSMAFDALFPVFLHLPTENHGGLNMDSGTIGMLYLFIGVGGIAFQFTALPRAIRRYGTVQCLRVISAIGPLLYIITPMTTFLPPFLYIIAASALMFTKIACTIFLFPCWNTLLNNSVTDSSNLGSVNGAATSLTGIGRALGPLIIGRTAFKESSSSYALPWWFLGGFGVVGAIPAYLEGVVGEGNGIN